MPHNLKFKILFVLTLSFSLSNSIANTLIGSNTHQDCVTLDKESYDQANTPELQQQLVNKINARFFSQLADTIAIEVEAKDFSYQDSNGNSEFVSSSKQSSNQEIFFKNLREPLIINKGTHYEACNSVELTTAVDPNAQNVYCQSNISTLATASGVLLRRNISCSGDIVGGKFSEDVHDGESITVFGNNCTLQDFETAICDSNKIYKLVESENETIGGDEQNFINDIGRVVSYGLEKVTPQNGSQKDLLRGAIQE